MAAIGGAQRAVAQVAHETGVVDRADRPQPHRSRRELPKSGHQPRVGIGAEPAAAGFLAVALEIGLRQAAFEKGPRIDAGGGMGLEKHQIAAVGFICGVEKMVEADLENLRRRSIAGDMATEIAIGLVGAHHHGQSVPADDGGDPLFQREIAGVAGLVFWRYGIAIGRIGLHARQDIEVLGLMVEALQQETGAGGTAGLDHRMQRVEPFARLHRVRICAGNRGGCLAEGFVNAHCRVSLCAGVAWRRWRCR